MSKVKRTKIVTPAIKNLLAEFGLEEHEMQLWQIRYSCGNGIVFTFAPTGEDTWSAAFLPVSPDAPFAYEVAQ